MADSEKFDKDKSNKKAGVFLQKVKQGIKNLLPYFCVFAVSFIFWELILRLQMGHGLSKDNLFFLFFIPAQALALTIINGLFPQKISRIIFPISLFIISLYYVIQIVYFRIFGSFFSVSMMKMGKDAVTNFGWAMGEVLLKSLGFIVLILVPIVVVIVLLVTKRIKCNPYHPILHLILIPMVIILWIAGIQCLKIDGTSKQSAYNIFVSAASDTDTTASRVGTLTTFTVELGSFYLGPDQNNSINSNTAFFYDPLIKDEIASENNEAPKINASFDFNALSQSDNEESVLELYDYIGNRMPSYNNEYTGIMEGYNVIYICAEGLWTYGINEKVTPTLYKMANNGIILSNYYNSFRNTTVNGEFALSTSLWPDVSRNASNGVDVGSMPQSSLRYMPLGLGNLFEKEGVPTYAFHNYYGDYYRRKQSWSNLGYENRFFMDEGMTFSTKWPASDYEMMQQSVDKYIFEDRFFAYYMTFSGHGPYSTSNCIYEKNIDEVKSRLGEASNNYSDEALGYLACNLELEKGIEYLVDRLEEEGIMDHTLIVITGDHYPYYLGANGRNELAGKNISDMDLYHSTCIMYTTGLSENIKCDTYCCNIDIVPTVLNLLGIDYDSRLFMGTDIFSSGIHKAVLYDKSFITDKVIYNSKTGTAEWKIDTKQYKKKDLELYLNSMSELIESEYSASIKIIENNFYYHLWKDSALITAEEASLEIEREARVKEELSTLNVEKNYWEESINAGLEEIKNQFELFQQSEPNNVDENQ